MEFQLKSTRGGSVVARYGKCGKHSPRLKRSRKARGSTQCEIMASLSLSEFNSINGSTCVNLIAEECYISRRLADGERHASTKRLSKAIGELGCCEEGIFAGTAKLQEPCMVSQSNVLHVDAT
jgi:hypothetical protein